MGSLENAFQFLGRLHPLVVHFPIALIITAGVLEVFRRWSSRIPAATVSLCLLGGALGAIVAAVFGRLNASYETHGRSVAETIFWHRWTGVSTAIAASVAWGLLTVGQRRSSSALIRSGQVGLLVAVVLVSIGGHQGGVLVYGEDYLFEVWRSKERAPVPAERVDDPQEPRTPEHALFSAVETVLSLRCVECHGPRKQKGRLRLDRRDGVLGPEPGDGVVVAGDLAGSELFRRITLPADHDDVMPSRGEPLAADQIEAFRAWIEGGAPWPAAAVVTEREEPQPDSTDQGDAGSPGAVSPSSSGASSEEALGKVAARGGSAGYRSSGSRDIEVNLAFTRPPINDSDLGVLQGLEAQLVRLDVSRTLISDTGLRWLADFTRLEHLDLSRTSVGNAGLEHLRQMDRLRYLNLYGTRVTDASISLLAELPSLRSVYLWQTGVSEDGASRLAELRPEMRVHRGADAVTTESVSSSSPTSDRGAEELPACCEKAREAGGDCDHPCCVEAAQRGEICPRCKS